MPGCTYAPLVELATDLDLQGSGQHTRARGDAFADAEQSRMDDARAEGGRDSVADAAAKPASLTKLALRHTMEAVGAQIPFLMKRVSAAAAVPHKDPDTLVRMATAEPGTPEAAQWDAFLAHVRHARLSTACYLYHCRHHRLPPFQRIHLPAGDMAALQVRPQRHGNCAPAASPLATRADRVRHPRRHPPPLRRGAGRAVPLRPPPRLPGPRRSPHQRPAAQHLNCRRPPQRNACRPPRKELHPFVRGCGLTRRDAEALHRAGIRTISALAEAGAEDVAHALRLGRPDSGFRGQARSATGGGADQREAAIRRDARACIARAQARQRKTADTGDSMQSAHAAAKDSVLLYDRRGAEAQPTTPHRRPSAGSLVLVDSARLRRRRRSSGGTTPVKGRENATPRRRHGWVRGPRLIERLARNGDHAGADSVGRDAAPSDAGSASVSTRGEGADRDEDETEDSESEEDEEDSSDANADAGPLGDPISSWCIGEAARIVVGHERERTEGEGWANDERGTGAGPAAWPPHAQQPNQEQRPRPARERWLESSDEEELGAAADAAPAGTAAHTAPLHNGSAVSGSAGYGSAASSASMRAVAGSGLTGSPLPASGPVRGGAGARRRHDPALDADAADAESALAVRVVKRWRDESCGAPQPRAQAAVRHFTRHTARRHVPSAEPAGGGPLLTGSELCGAPRPLAQPRAQVAVPRRPGGPKPHCEAVARLHPGMGCHRRLRGPPPHRAAAGGGAPLPRHARRPPPRRDPRAAAAHPRPRTLARAPSFSLPAARRPEHRVVDPALRLPRSPAPAHRGPSQRRRQRRLPRLHVQRCRGPHRARAERDSRRRRAAALAAGARGACGGPPHTSPSDSLPRSLVCSQLWEGSHIKVAFNARRQGRIALLNGIQPQAPLEDPSVAHWLLNPARVQTASLEDVLSAHRIPERLREMRRRCEERADPRREGQGGVLPPTFRDVRFAFLGAPPSWRPRHASADPGAAPDQSDPLQGLEVLTVPGWRASADRSAHGAAAACSAASALAICWLRHRLADRNLVAPFRRVETPLLPVLATMERWGIGIRREPFEQARRCEPQRAG